MSIEAKLAIGFGVGAVLSAALAHLAIRLAPRLGLVDEPVGWKIHSGATPYAGWATVGGAAAGAAVAAGSEVTELAVPLVLALVLCAIGIRDDREPLRALPRVLAELAAGVALFAADFAWRPTGVDAIDLAATCLLVFAAINALNLIDLLDGVAATCAGVSALGCGLILAGDGDLASGAIAMGTAGACAGFLTLNLASPSRAFLGDGGTMPLGLLVATAAISSTGGHDGVSALVAAPLLLAVPALDMAYRVAHRLHRGIPLLSPGRDSLATHLENRFGSPRPVALVAGLAQAVAVVVAALVLGPGGWLAAAALAAAGVVAALAMLAIRRNAREDIEADALARGPEREGSATTLTGVGAMGRN